MNWLDLFGSVEYDLPLVMQRGDAYQGGPGYPDAVIQSSELVEPDRILVQRVELAASDPSTDRRQKIRIYRVVAEMGDGEAVELTRKAVPSKAPEPVDQSTCAACLGQIPEGQARIRDGKAYHPICSGGADGVADSDGDTTDRVRPARSGGSGDQGEEAEGPRATSAAETPQTVTKTRSYDGISVSHLVSVTSIDGDHEAVTMWAREMGARSGTVVGRWSRGLFHGELPMDHDVQYIDQKFFGAEGLVTASDLRVWNHLFKKAFRELNPPR